MDAIPAIYENGVFRPLAPVNLPENTWVDVTLRSSVPADSLERARNMIAQGASELDRNETVDASDVFAEMAARRVRLQAERACEL